MLGLVLAPDAAILMTTPFWATMLVSTLLAEVRRCSIEQLGAPSYRCPTRAGRMRTRQFAGNPRPWTEVRCAAARGNVARWRTTGGQLCDRRPARQGGSLSLGENMSAASTRLLMS